MVFPMVFVQVPWSFNVGKKTLFHSEVLLNNASSKWWACHPTKEDQMNSIYSYFFHHFLNPCGFFPQEISIKSRIVPPKNRSVGLCRENIHGVVESYWIASAYQKSSYPGRFAQDHQQSACSFGDIFSVGAVFAHGAGPERFLVPISKKKQNSKFVNNIEEQ